MLDHMGIAHKVYEPKASMREVHLLEVKYCEDTGPCHQLEAFSKQHKTLRRRLKATQFSLHNILLGVEVQS